MARSGFAGVVKAKENFEEQQKQWEGMKTRDMRLVKDGDEAEIWFIGCEPDEPAEALVHSYSPGGKSKFSYELCGHGHEDHEGCVYCHVVKAGDKRVKKASKNFYFSVADGRWVHKTKNEERSRTAGREVFDWMDCPDNPSCKACKRKVPRERGGLKKLRLGLTTAIVVNNLNDSLKKRCTNCNGKITITGYRKGKKVLPDLDGVDEPEEWTPEVECSKCDDPNPGNIFQCPIIMRRNGSGQTTTYAFEKGDDFQDQPDWVQELEPIDFSVALTPRSAENMAKQLDTDNPYDKDATPRKKAKASGADSYDDEDDDEDELPTKAKGKAAIGEDDED
jgi:hypothetical protein